ncbi:hypothetical protein [Candidatus Rickettsiella viridis]|nr:hypothetical protein [Candidatus Rickettsiella viridis]
MLRISSDQHFKLNSLAEEAHVSIEEIASRAIDAFQLKTMEEEQELEILAEAVIESNKKAIKSLKEAHEALQDTLAHFARN